MISLSALLSAKVLVPVGLLVLEWWLGRTKMVEANSTLELAQNVVGYVMPKIRK